MKMKFFLAAVALMGCIGGRAQSNCEIPMCVQVDAGFSNVTEETASLLYTQLQRIGSQSGLSTGWTSADFLLTAKFDMIDKYVVDAAPTKVVSSYTVTLMVADVHKKRLFSSTSFDVKGVGDSDTKSSMDAVKRLSAENGKIKAFMQKARRDIINYYDSQLPSIIKDAQMKAEMKQYPEAFYLLSVVPTCCNNYEKAKSEAFKIYSKYVDTISLQLYNKAKGIWAANPSPEGAAEAVELLSGIDPDAKCYKQAMSLLSQIGKTQRKDYEFEVKEKYKDAVGLEKLRINAMTQMGKAWAANQPKNVITILGGGRY